MPVFFLFGCGQTKIVKVPVPIPCPEPPEIQQPKLPISDLDANAKYDEVAKAYAETVILLKEHSEKLEHLLNSYRKNKDGNPNN